MLLATLLAVPLVGAGGPAAEAEVPGENGRIAYSQFQRPATPQDISMPYDVWTSEPDGSDPRKVDTGDSYSAQSPAYSADGRKIAFVDLVPPPAGVYGPPTWQVFVVEVDRSGAAVGEPVQVTGDAGGAGDPSFSPDGRMIAYTASVHLARIPGDDRNYADGVVVVRSDGTGGRTLVDGATRERSSSEPDWSPDGRRIAFSAKNAGEASDIYVAEVDPSSGAPAGPPLRVTDHRDYDTDPDWSPDGGSIAYAGWDATADSEVFVTPAVPGGARRQVTDTPRSSGQANGNPSFSPDGRYIAYDGGAEVYIDLDSEREVYVVAADAEGGEGVPLTPAGGEVSERPSWGSVPVEPPPDVAPPAPPVLDAPADRSYLAASAVTVSGTAEAGSTVELFDGASSLGAVAAGPDGRWSRTLSGVADGAHAYAARATDAAGNASAPSAPRAVTVDTARPGGSASINAGARTTGSRSVVLTLRAVDPRPASGVARMCVSNSPRACASWEPYAPKKRWRLAGTASGTKTVYVRYEDRAGNRSAVLKDTIRYVRRG